MTVEMVAGINSPTAARALKFEEGFLAKIPMPMINDPTNPGTLIPKYATTKEHLKADIIKRYLRIAEQGHDIIKLSVGKVMNEDDLS